MKNKNKNYISLLSFILGVIILLTILGVINIALNWAVEKLSNL